MGVGPDEDRDERGEASRATLKFTPPTRTLVREGVCDSGVGPYRGLRARSRIWGDNGPGRKARCNGVGEDNAEGLALHKRGNRIKRRGSIEGVLGGEYKTAGRHHNRPIVHRSIVPDPAWVVRSIHCTSRSLQTFSQTQ